MWFKKVKKQIFFKNNTKITSYKINGIDSLQALNKYFGSKVISKDINNTYFEETFDKRYVNHFPSFVIPLDNGLIAYVDFYYNYSNKYKQIYIYYLNLNMDTAVFKRNLFGVESGTWDIVKFDPSGERKIKKLIKNDTYEITFN